MIIYSPDEHGRIKAAANYRTMVAINHAIARKLLENPRIKTKIIGRACSSKIAIGMRIEYDSFSVPANLAVAFNVDRYFNPDSVVRAMLSVAYSTILHINTTTMKGQTCEGNSRSKT